MKCDLDDNLLSAYQDGELPEESQALVANHLKSCPGCEEKLRLYKSIKEVSASLMNVEAPYYLVSKTINHIERQSSYEDLFFWQNILSGKSYLRSALISLIIVFIVSVGLVSYNSINPVNKFESLVLVKQMKINPYQESPISKDTIDDIELIAHLASFFDDQIFESSAPLKDIAMLLDFKNVEKRKIFDSITFFSDRTKQPIVESHFEW